MNKTQSPVAEDQQDVRRGPATDSTSDPLTVIAKRVFEGRKILIVEDDEHLQQAVVVRLQSVGFETVTAADGLTAVQACREQQPDIVLLDLGLPCGDGFKVIDRIRALEQVSETPIVVMTGRDNPNDVQRCLGSGAQEYLTKPVCNEDLMAALAEALGRR